MTRGPDSNLDLAIIGAGAAGLAAAIASRSAGLRVQIFEARSRIGGRAYTEMTSLGLPLDRGCHWLHSASTNTFTRLADAHGFTYRCAPPSRGIYLHGRWATPDEIAAWQAFFRDNYRRISETGRAGRDVAAATVVDTEAPWRGLLDYVIAAVNGVGPGQYSTGDYANEGGTDEDWPVREGLGRLVALAGAAQPVALKTPVHRVEWGRDGVRLSTPRGTVSARATLITVPPGVLAAEGLAFAPPLPQWKQRAIDGIAMGAAAKAAFRFNGDVFGLADDTYVLAPTPDHGWMGFHVKPFGQHVAVGYAGGDQAVALEQAGAGVFRETALDTLCGVFGQVLRDRLEAATTTAWWTDRYSAGAHSAARPGCSHCRAWLARPIGKCLFFAGEATSRDAFATVHGAWRTGARAANEVARCLGMAA